ncbi:hypothetical protein V2J09_005900 [Rumex salicifolius]
MKSSMFLNAQCIMKNIAPACRRLLLLPGMSSNSSSSSAQQQHIISKSSVSFNSSQKHHDFSEVLKRKLSLRVKIIQVGGIERMYRRVFKTTLESERILKASQCYLWTTSGPIAGLLFVSTERVAFCSDQPIKVSSTDGELIGRSYYKVSIPTGKIARAAQRDCLRRQKMDKYLQVITNDEFEFWFIGIVGLKKTFKCLQEAVVTYQGCGRI